MGLDAIDVTILIVMINGMLMRVSCSDRWLEARRDRRTGTFRD